MKIRGGQLPARALQQKGVSQVFTLSGGFCNPALEGFMECGIVALAMLEKILECWDAGSR